MIDVMYGDCLELMKNIPDKSVDMVLCDLPYGMVDAEWDSVIPFEALWEQYHRICKENAAILLFAIQPFATDLINSNRKEFRYDIIWEKTLKCGFFNAHKMPLRSHEEILVFYKKLPTYNPIKTKKEGVKIGHKRKNSKSKTFGGSVYQGTKCEKWEYVETGERFPTSIIKFSNWNGASKHPTQKPVPLLEYLIKTYTNDGETVLDNTMGSGSTGVACVNTERNFIGIEKNNYYFDVAKERIEQAEKGKIIYSRTSAGLMAANKTEFL
jgi:site-specific DNA-methyltransferase (adenine-specific)